MKTNVQDTSIAAYRHLELGSMQDQERKIVEVMSPGMVYSRRHLSILVGLDTSTVSGRVNSLIYKRHALVVEGTIHCCFTDRKVQAVRLATAAETSRQKELALEV